MHEKALRIVYQGTKFSFKTLLKRDRFVSIHMKNDTCLTASTKQ